MSHHPLDVIAHKVFERARIEKREGELFECLLEGGGATVDFQTGQLVLVSATQLSRLSDALVAQGDAEET